MKTKKIFAFLLALMLCIGMMPFASVTAHAATSSDLASRVSSNLPIVTYAMPLSGASRVYSYSNSSLSSNTTGYYIDTYTDQIVITQISSNGKAVYVTYPSSSSSSGYRSRWFAADDILGVSSVSLLSYTASGKSTTYRMSASSRVTSYGSIASSDSCVRLGSHSVGGSTYYPTIYPISSTRVNGVSGVRHKLALATTAGSSSSASTSTASWQWPVSGYTVNQSFNHYSSSMASYKGRPYHCGMDMYSSNTNIYAAAAGTVVYKGYSSGNGYHVILSHNINGTTVRTLYSHLSSYSACPAVGRSVAKGAKIGVMGSTGNSTGIHLHFAIYTGSSNDPYGYATSGGTNKISYGGCVFYNPAYVIANGKLPS